MPTTHAEVQDVSNLWLTESEPRGVVCTTFVENLGGAHMRGTRAGADPHC